MKGRFEVIINDKLVFSCDKLDVKLVNLGLICVTNISKPQFYINGIVNDSKQSHIKWVNELIIEGDVLKINYFESEEMSDSIICFGYSKYPAIEDTDTSWKTVTFDLVFNDNKMTSSISQNSTIQFEVTLQGDNRYCECELTSFFGSEYTESANQASFLFNLNINQSIEIHVRK